MTDATAYPDLARATFRSCDGISRSFDKLHEAMFRTGQNRLHNTSADAARRVALFLRDIGNPFPITDLGSGTGGLLVFLACCFPDQDFTGVEIDEHLFRHANDRKQQLALANLAFAQGDMFALPVTPGMTYIMINPLDRALTKKLAHRILSTDNTAIITASRATQYLWDTSATAKFCDNSYINLTCWTGT